MIAAVILVGQCMAEQFNAGHCRTNAIADLKHVRDSRAFCNIEIG